MSGCPSPPHLKPASLSSWETEAGEPGLPRGSSCGRPSGGICTRPACRFTRDPRRPAPSRCAWSAAPSLYPNTAMGQGASERKTVAKRVGLWKILRMESRSIIAERLEERMRAVGTNPHRLSKAIGARDTVRMILSGRAKSPRSDTLQGLARELGCDVRYLLGETDEPGDSAPTESSSDISMATLPGGKARLRVNMVVPYAVAVEVLAKLGNISPALTTPEKA